MTIDDFNQSLLDGGSDKIPLMVDKYLIQGLPSVFNGSEEDHYEFKKRFANKFNVGTHEIFIVGSSKLGFSYRKGTPFSIDSDIDVAIVNSTVFDEYNEIVKDYIYDLRSKLFSHTEQESKQFAYFTRCMALGFIRPDIFPQILSRANPKPEWEAFFKSISSGRSEIGNHDVKGIIYRSYGDLHRYQIYGLHSKLKELEVKRDER